MEKLTLKPLSNEIVVNNGAAEGAVDVFCYTPDEASLRNLGALYVIGHRETDSSNMGYMVSLIAALARREYYAQAAIAPREAFARTLRKANEVVEEFFRSGDVKLSVGIVAVAAGQVMVSKLDKFKILLARENQVIDILSNVLLFSKEHTEKRRFSSIIHGSVQAGDRILAFVPTRAVSARERNLKAWFLRLPQDEFAARVTQIGTEHASFATAMLHIDIAQIAEPAVMPSPQPPELMPQEPPQDQAVMPSLASSPTSPPAPMSWTPRQQAAEVLPMPSPRPQAVTVSHAVEAEPEVPHIIPSEFSLGTRRTLLSRWVGRVRWVRLDTRGKAITLAVTVALVAGGILLAKSILFVSPQDQEQRQALERIRQDVADAQSKISSAPVTARQVLTRALTAIAALRQDDATQQLSATIGQQLDSVDHAQASTPTLVASPQPDTPTLTLAAWASASQTVWVGATGDDGSLWAAPLRDGVPGDHVNLGTVKADLLLGWRKSVVAVDFADHTLVRLVSGTAAAYTMDIQETVLDAAQFGDNIYVLTDKSIFKISDLDTLKPAMKRWLVSDDQLASGAVRIWVDGSVYTAGRDGTLTTYYKGKATQTATAPLALSGTWRMTGASDGLIAFTAGDARRIYLVNPADGSLVRTLKVDSELPFTYISAGPDGSVLLRTAESKIWQAR